MKPADKQLWLRDVVRMFCVSFQIKPTYVGMTGDGPEVGFELELIGTHQKVRLVDQSEYAQRQRVLFTLLELADQSLPKQGDSAPNISTRCERHFRYTSHRGDRPVVLRVMIFRKAKLEDAAADRLLELGRLMKFADDIKTALESFGCKEVGSDGLPLPPWKHEVMVAAQSAA